MSRSRLENLRERAEALLQTRGSADMPRDFREMVQEFQVLQAELEVQAEELQRAHGAAEKSRRHYFELFEHSPAGLMLLDPFYVVLDANRHAADMLERPLEQVRRASITRFIDGPDQATFAQLVQRVPMGTVTGEFTVRQGTGGRLVVRARLLLREDGTFLMAIEDVTPLRRAEAESREVLDRYHALFEGTSDAVIVVDNLTRRMLEVNATTCQLLQTTRDNLVGRAREELFPLESRVAASMTLDRALRERAPVSGLPLQASSGQTITVEMTLSSLGDGRLTLMLVRRSP